MTRPQRMRLQRRKGFDLQAASRALNGLVAKPVTRPGRWGNPFAIAAMAEQYGLGRQQAQAKAIETYGLWVAGKLDLRLSPGPPPDRAAIIAELGGKNLACWCRPGEPCHADILIGLANP